MTTLPYFYKYQDRNKARALNYHWIKQWLSSAKFYLLYCTILYCTVLYSYMHLAITEIDTRTVPKFRGTVLLNFGRMPIDDAICQPVQLDATVATSIGYLQTWAVRGKLCFSPLLLLYRNSLTLLILLSLVQFAPFLFNGVKEIPLEWIVQFWTKKGHDLNR